MKPHPVFKIINKQFIEAVNKLQRIYGEHPTKKRLTDNSIARVISPNNRSIVGKIRQEESNLTHYQMLTFADKYQIPYAYFYDERSNFSCYFDEDNGGKLISEVTFAEHYVKHDDVNELTSSDTAIKNAEDTPTQIDHLIQATKQMNEVKDQLIESKDEQIKVLTKYNQRLEKLLDQS